MIVVKAWYKEGSDVYHNNDSCETGKNIEPYYTERGTGNNLRQCERCKELEARQNLGGIANGLFAYNKSIFANSLAGMKKANR
jgi:hypothetical protein